MAKPLKLDTSSLKKGVEGMQDRIDMAIRLFAENGAKALERDAKQNAKWTNRTGHARQRLRGYVSKVENGYKIYLAHGVDYGLWLELANEKKYSIIPQTIQKTGESEIMPAFKNFMKKLEGN